MILGFDTSAGHCAIGFMDDDGQIVSSVHPMSKGQAESLFPLIQDLLHQSGYDWPDISRIGVGVGPGNFTGVRLAVSAARGLALSRGIPAIGVTRFDAIAFDTVGPVLVALDARRGGIYIQNFVDGLALASPELIEADDLNETARGKTILGDIALDDANFTVHPFDMEKFIPNLLHITAKAPADGPRPAPMYLRAADAALPSDPVPTLLP